MAEHHPVAADARAATGVINVDNGRSRYFFAAFDSTRTSSACRPPAVLLYLTST
jgi:hypothetical protein